MSYEKARGRTLSRLGVGGSILAVALLSGFCFSLVAAMVDHHDDGCAVELHCFACRWQLASQVILAGAVLGPAAPQFADFILAPVVETEAPAIECERSSRGPPSFQIL